MLQVDNIHTYYGDSHILHGVSLDVKAGRIRFARWASAVPSRRTTSSEA